MNLEDLNFNYPEELVAVRPSEKSRVLFANDSSYEDLAFDHFLNRFQEGDVIVINETKVLQRRVKSINGFEVVFIKSLSNNQWQVLLALKKWPQPGGPLLLPGGLTLELVQGGFPQIVKANQEIDERYFEKYGKMPLPPYILKMRNDDGDDKNDLLWYQTEWAYEGGSLASPTASLHFTANHLKYLESKRVKILKIILHVGLGTFSPIRTLALKDHQMHFEEVKIPLSTWHYLENAKKEKRTIWALGTTVARALESAARDLLTLNSQDDLVGQTDLFIYPPYSFKMVDRLMTNFHQPKTTLLALVAAFAGLERVMEAYEWAIKNRFRLFSYGDLTVWTPK